MTAYATIDDVYLLGLTARAFAVAPSQPQAVDLVTGTIRLPAHGLGMADHVTFFVTAGGGLTPELSPFIYYPVAILGGDLFKVLDPVTGTPITFSQASRGWTVSADSVRRLQAHLDDATARINACLPAHATPIATDVLTGAGWGPLRGLCARMAARSAVRSLLVENPVFREPMDRLFASAAFDGDTDPPAQPGSLLGDWKNGMPILPTPIDQTTTPEMGARSSSTRCRFERGWTTGRL